LRYRNLNARCLDAELQSEKQKTNESRFHCEFPSSEFVPERKLHHARILRAGELTKRSRVRKSERGGIAEVEIDFVESVECLSSELNTMLFPLQRKSLADG